MNVFISVNISVNSKVTSINLPPVVEANLPQFLETFLYFFSFAVFLNQFIYKVTVMFVIMRFR